MLDRRIFENRKKVVGHRSCFYHKRWYNVNYGLEFSKKVQLQIMISTKRDEIDYSLCMGAIYFSIVIYGSELKSSNIIKTSIILDQL
jgi:hypothetical protein